MSKNNEDIKSFRINSNKTDFIIRALASHPYIGAFIICMIIHQFYLGSWENVPANALLIEFMLVLFIGYAVIYHLYKIGRFRKRQAQILAVLFTVIDFTVTEMYSQTHHKGLWLFTGGCAILFILYYYSDTKKYRTQLNALLIMGISFLVKFYYVFYTSVYTRQHDVGTFGSPDRHAGYIEYLLFNHKLPDFDVREVWQYCHPPLHHTLCAVWIHINENIFGVGHEPARESLQTLTLFYSMVIVITAYRILRHFKLEGIALYVPLGIIAFHPAFILFSGSINNDVLSVAFMMGAVLCTLKWYRNQTLSGIIKIALCVGLGIMTKLSAALVAPPIAVVFLAVFIRKFKTEGLKLFRQFAVFGAVCVPLGLWFEIRNYVKWKVPITYVQEMSKNELQYLGSQSFFSRITDFSPTQLKSVFEQWAWYDDSGILQGYNEYNPLIALLKNSIFGEFINEECFAEGSYVLKISTLFFWLGVILAAIALFSMVIMCFRKCAMKPLEKVFFVLFYITMMGNFYKMSYDYPFTCTMNFRYITPTVIVGSLFIGLMTDKICSRKGKIYKAISYFTSTSALLFALCSTIVYISVC